jgi:2-C-methyl-D-erythritol 4-phosphate cytidylyltransferase
VIWCVIPAAGAGRRFGGPVPKQYRSILGRPMLERTMERLASHPRVAGLLVVLAADDDRWPGTVLCMGKPVRTCVGGEERVDSVLAGLEYLTHFVHPDDWIMVHDAARPCVRHEDIERLVIGAVAHPVGAILGGRVRDTIKFSGDGAMIDATVPRENLWRAFTPQMFHLGELTEALHYVRSQPPTGTPVTDEASALEAVAKFPLLIEGYEDNLKVTAGSDLLQAEWILKVQGNSA